MSGGLSIYGGDMSEAFRFLDSLSANNNRQWFQQHKDDYEAVMRHWLVQLQRLIDAMSEWEPRLSGLTAKQCAYRIYRDTRFSPDKTPYKVYLSASFSPRGRMAHAPGYYLQLDSRPGELGLYGGVWCPESAVLAKLRRAVVDNIEEWEELLSEPQLAAGYPGWCGVTLKTVPKGWPRNHPQAEYLRLKDFGKFMPLQRETFADPDWPLHVAGMFRPLKPLVDFLQYSIDEDV